MKAWLRKLIKELIKDWIDEAYTLGYEAGMNAERFKEKEDHNRRLHELYKYGYIRGVEDTAAEIGEITIDDIGEALGEEDDEE